MAILMPNPDETPDPAARVHSKYRPVWDACGPRAAAALSKYFLPGKSRKSELCPTRPKIVKWYCPFAHQCEFPTGHRYCINVYRGCAHRCEYCYARAYEPDEAGCKNDFARGLAKDLNDLDTFDVPPAPVHLSNSTDPFQNLELDAGHTRLALEQLLRYRHRFTSVIILTKNPRLASSQPYLGLLQQFGELAADHPSRETLTAKGLPSVRVEVSLAFWSEEARAAMDPGAPTVKDRLESIRALRQAGVPVVLRIDPLFPRSPFLGKAMADYGLPECQPLEDLDRLLSFAAEVGVMHVVYSPAKILRRPSSTMQKLKRVYDDLAAPMTAPFCRGSWRLPFAIAESLVVGPFLDLCRKHGASAQYCKQNLITTP